MTVFDWSGDHGYYHVEIESCHWMNHENKEVFVYGHAFRHLNQTQSIDGGIESD
jgi:hypothetical protein